MAGKAESAQVPEAMKPIYDSIVEMTDAFCQKELNEEYAEVCRKMAATLARKRPSPLMTGKINTWACGIAYSVGQINFAFDKSKPPFTKPATLCEAFGLAASTGSNKAKEIRDKLKINFMDWKFMLPSKLETSSMPWTIMVDGFILDVRHCTEEIQEEAFRKGLIPYVPGKRK